VVDLHPDFAHYVWEAEGCAPLIVSGPKLAAVRELLAEHAREMEPAPGKIRRKADPHAA
jgi:hypothetical protein